MRLRDESAAIREASPDAVVDLAAVVTDLGGSTGLILVVALVYWLSRERERAAVVAGYAVVGVAVVVLLKSLFAMPRPPEAVWAIPHDDDPYGFPSGHAFMSVLVYGGLVVGYDRLDDGPVLAGAVALIGAISLSRVVLGVHYLADVVVGAALGLALLVGLSWTLGDDPRFGFGLGGLVAVPAAVVSGADPYALVALGAGVGGLVATTQLDRLPRLRSRIEGAILAVLGLLVVAVVGAIEAALAAGVAAAVVVNAVLFAAILLVPAAVPAVRLSLRRVAGRGS